MITDLPRRGKWKTDFDGFAIRGFVAKSSIKRRATPTRAALFDPDPYCRSSSLDGKAHPGTCSSRDIAGRSADAPIDHFAFEGCQFPRAEICSLHSQYAVQWGWEPKPEWFDHYLDQHWQWSAINNSLWVERGVFSRLVIKPNATMLEICCGDGFNARHFYSSQAASIIAIDFDKAAIPHAKRYNSAPNITYIQQDIRLGLPLGPFDNIVWDAAIEHFTEIEIDRIMSAIVERLGADGILSGYTLTERLDGRQSNALHEYEFKDKEDLRRFFTPHFKFVKVWETVYPTRHNLYFVASQTLIEVFG